VTLYQHVGFNIVRQAGMYKRNLYEKKAYTSFCRTMRYNGAEKWSKSS
jgi:hypothetical protein